MPEPKFVYDESTKTLTVEYVDKDSRGVFYGYEGCEKLILKEGIKELPKFCFSNYKEIEELILPDSLESLPDGFIPEWYDRKLKKVHLGKGLKTISYFDKNYFGFEKIPHLSVLSDLKDIETVTIDPDNGCFKIENDLFLSKDGSVIYAYIGKGCKELVIPDTVKEIKGHAFNDCYRIEKLIVPGTIKTIGPSFVHSRIGELVLEEGVEEISDNAFIRSYIENIKFPKSITKFGKHPFIDAYQLKTLKLYEGIEYFYKPILSELLGEVSDSAFWFNPDGHFYKLEFIEIYDKNDTLLRRYGLIANEEKNGEYLSGTWFQSYHQNLFYSIAGWEWKWNQNAKKAEDEYIKAPLNYTYIKDWQHFKNATTKKRFICGILPELDNINAEAREEFLTYTKKNIKAIRDMAQTYNFANVIEILDKLDSNKKEQTSSQKTDNKVSKKEEQTAKCERLLQILNDKYGGKKARLNHVNNMSLPISKEEKKYLVDNAPKVYGMSLTDLLLERDILYKAYTLPKSLTADITLKTKLNGSIATFKYNVDTTEIRNDLDLISNNWCRTDNWGCPLHIPVMATPESVAAYDEASKNMERVRPQIVTIPKDEGIKKIVAFIERCAEYASISKIGECLSKLPKKADSSVKLKRAAVIDWSEICIEGRFYELVIMAKSATEIEMSIRSKKCDMENFTRVTNG